MDFKELQKQIDKMGKHRTPQKIEEVQTYLNDKLRERIDDPTAEVVSLLIYDKGRQRINCYLNQISDSELFRELNMSTLLRVHYHRGVPTEDAYSHGTFVPLKQENQDGVTSRFERKITKNTPENHYIALGRNIPTENLDDLVTYSY